MKTPIRETEDEILAAPEDQTMTQSRDDQRRKNQAARRLLREWRADTSGYDEEAWPQVRQLIEENRLSPRSRFGD